MGIPAITRDIRDYIAATLTLSNIYADAMIPNTVAQYAVIEYPGPGNIKTHGAGTGSGVQLDQAMIQVMCRDKVNATCRSNILAIVDALDGKPAVTINTRVYTSIALYGRPRKLMNEEDGSSVWVAEFQIQCRR